MAEKGHSQTWALLPMSFSIFSELHKIKLNCLTNKYVYSNLMLAIVRKDTLEERLLTIKEVADKLRVTQYTIFRLMKSGKLRHVKVSRRFTRIREKDLEAFLDRYTFGKDEKP